MTGRRWKDLPRSFPSKNVCHLWFTQWVTTGVFQRGWSRLLELKDDLQQLDLDTLLGDATFIPAKKGGDDVGPTESGRGSKIILLTDRNGCPLHADISSASRHYVTLIEPLLATAPAIVDQSKRLVYDKAADSEPLRRRLKSWGLRLIHSFIKRYNQPEWKLPPRDQRHYSHRWKIERTFA